jgi:hypothetical protein
LVKFRPKKHEDWTEMRRGGEDERSDEKWTKIKSGEE